MQWRSSSCCCKCCESPDPLELCCNDMKANRDMTWAIEVLQVTYAFVVSAFREKNLPAPETKKQS